MKCGDGRNFLDDSKTTDSDMTYRSTVDVFTQIIILTLRLLFCPILCNIDLCDVKVVIHVEMPKAAPKSPFVIFKN